VGPSTRDAPAKDVPIVVDQLFPLFALHSNLVGWIVPERHVFDRTMNWIAYMSDGYAWSVATGNWLGPISPAGHLPSTCRTS
jgi:hypothetical protein